MKKLCTCWRRCQGVPALTEMKVVGRHIHLDRSAAMHLFLGSTDVSHPSIPSLFPWFLSDCCCDHFRSSKNFTPTNFSCLKKNQCSLLPKERWGETLCQWCLLQAGPRPPVIQEKIAFVPSPQHPQPPVSMAVGCLGASIPWWKNHLWFFSRYIFI